MINLRQKAEKWVSATVLIGCVVITGVLIFAAYQAQVLGSHLTPQSASILDSESF